jgi:hypothetical protein
LIFLAFFLPLALYLIVLGAINRRRRPLMVSGTWDFIGILFAASGFLLCGGPAVLGGLNERWRMFWLTGQRGAGPGGADGAWQFWVFLSALYFVVVVAGSAYLLWSQRQLTAVYNVERRAVEQALAQVCERLGLRPVRSGDLFLFGMAPAGSDRKEDRLREPPGGGVRAGPYGPADGPPPADSRAWGAAARGSPGRLIPAGELLGQTATLQLDDFALMRHVSLRWDPADSPLRQEVEGALAGQLAEAPAARGELGGWLLLLGLFLLLSVCTGGFALLVMSLFLR